MKELKEKIKQCTYDRRIYKAKLEEIYEVVLGDNGFKRYDQAEFIDFLKMIHGDYLLMQEATSDEYIELLRRQEGEV
jgi:hypothetical protein